MCIPNTALNNYSKLTETSVQRSPNDGIVNGPLQKGSLTILLSMSIFLERKSACIFRVEWGRKPPSFFFSTSAKVEIRAYSKQKLPVKLIFSVQNEILGKKIQCREEGNAPKKVDFTPKPARIWRKRAPAFKCK